jgi:hypothetical protein
MSRAAESGRDSQMAIAASASSSLFDRMLRAARLDSSLYDEVDADASATTQALTVVVLTAVATAIGGAIGASITGHSGALAAAIVGGLLTQLLGWVVWAFVVTWVGNTLLGGKATYTRMLRSLGFAYSPGVLNILKFIPVLGGLISLVVGIWQLVTSFIAIREGMQFDNGKTIATMIVGVIAILIVFAIVGVITAAIFGVGYALGNMGA